MLRRPGLSSIILVIGAFALLFGGSAIIGSGEPTAGSIGLARVVLSAFAVMWFGAFAVNIPAARPAVRPFLVVGLVFYAIAFALPSARQGSTEYLGFDCFLQAMFLVPEAWIANPLLLVTFALARRGSIAASIVVGVAALGFGMLAPVHEGITVRVGFFIWMLGIAIPLAGTVLTTLVAAKVRSRALTDLGSAGGLEAPDSSRT